MAITKQDIAQAHKMCKSRRSTVVYITTKTRELRTTPLGKWDTVGDFPPGFVGAYGPQVSLRDLTDDIRAIELHLIANPPPRGNFQSFSKCSAHNKVARAATR